jgi:acyl-CoA thioesterase II
MLERLSVPITPGRAQRWVRLNSEPIDDPVVAACGLAFISDAAPTSAARASHPLTQFDGEDRDRFIGASIDHAIWFHRPCMPTDWHWCDMRSNGVRSGRGLVQGTMLAADGRHVATVVQEVLLRVRRPRPDRPDNATVSIDNEEV